LANWVKTTRSRKIVKITVFAIIWNHLSIRFKVWVVTSLRILAMSLFTSRYSNI
jgi:hypothetical protein